MSNYWAAILAQQRNFTCSHTGSSLPPPLHTAFASLEGFYAMEWEFSLETSDKTAWQSWAADDEPCG